MPFVLEIEKSEVKEIDLRQLAHLGDAVFELYEREVELLSNPNSKKMHASVVSKVNATHQASLLENLMTDLTAEETDLVRRARNLKPGKYKKIDQSTYRYATAFEALIGFLYLTDRKRLAEILGKTRFL